MGKYVFVIGECEDRSLVGGKGSSLSIMKNLGLNVPPGLTITTSAWRAWKEGRIKIKTLYANHIKPILSETIPGIGVSESVSVRSGAAQSMPGMMETILNLGAKSSVQRVAYINSYIKANGMDTELSDKIVEESLIKSGKFFVDDSLIGLETLVSELSDYAGPGVKGTIDNRIMAAIRIVFESWDSEKATIYRERSGIPHDLGTACTIQKMVNGFDGLSGVMLTRGDHGRAQIDWLPNAQGDSIVDGSRAPFNASQLRDRRPLTYRQLVNVGAALESAYRDAVDVEFTEESDCLFVLQCRTQKRSAVDAMRIACELHQDGIYSDDQLLAVPVVDDSVEMVTVNNAKPIAHGTPVSGRLITGVVNIEQEKFQPGQICIRRMTTTDDIELMLQASAVLTVAGGPTCHAALVARELNIPAVVGVGGVIQAVRLKKGGDYQNVWGLADYRLADGDVVTITPDGSIYFGEAALETVRVAGEWGAVLSDKQAKLKSKAGLA